METNYGPDLGYWSIFTNEQPEEFLGWVFLTPYDDVGNDLEIGLRLIRGAWGKGYTTEVVKIILEHGLQKVGSNRIVAEIDPQNVGSVKIATKSGMKEVASNAQDDCADLLFFITA